MRELRRDYTLFIDESGQFGEEALREERLQERPSSQICGILLPGIYEKKRRGDDLPPALLSLFPKGGEKHAVDMSHADRAKLLEKVIKLTKRSEWRLVRLVNNSGIGEGAVIQTYTRMVAELIVCLYQSLCEERPNEQPVIHLTYAQVLLGKRVEGRDYYFSRNEVSSAIRHRGSPIMIPILEYQEAISRELHIDLRYGLGLAEDETNQILGKVIEESARIHPALQLSDIVSNGTYKRGRAMRHYPGVRAQILDLIEPYDYELHPLKPQHQAEDLASHRALGQAISLTLYNLNQRTLSEEATSRLEETLQELLEDLSEEHSAELRSDLQAIIDGIEDIVQRQRDASVAEHFIQVIMERVIDPLEKLILDVHGQSDLNWARYRILNLALANANHSGEIGLARERREALNALRSSINDRWEEIPIVMESQLNIAISLGEELDFSAGVELAEKVCGFYQDLSSMLGAFRGEELIAPQLKMSGHISALGTTLTLERYLCLTKLVRGEVIDDVIDRGRSIGAEALTMCHIREDRMRFHQQLAHLESLGGSYERAWTQLYEGLDGDPPLSSSSSLSELRGACIMALDDLSGEELLFPLFHCLRLCVSERQKRKTEDLIEIAEDLIKLSQRRVSELLSGQTDDYPAHGILRAWSTLNASLGDDAAAIGGLRVLERLVAKESGAIGLRLVTLCAHIEVAVLLAQMGKKDRALQVLQKDKRQRGRTFSRQVSESYSSFNDRDPET